MIKKQSYLLVVVLLLWVLVVVLLLWLLSKLCNNKQGSKVVKNATLETVQWTGMTEYFTWVKVAITLFHVFNRNTELRILMFFRTRPDRTGPDQTGPDRNSKMTEIQK